MLNTTIVSLHMMSLLSTSPLYTIRNQFNGLVRTSFYNSHFSHMFTNVFVSYTNKHQTLFNNNLFSHSLSTPLKFVSEYNCGINSSNSNVDMPIQNQLISDSNFTGDNLKNKRAYFKSDCGDISIYFCTFLNCYSQDENGGSILVTQDCVVVIHSTQFIGSHTTMNRGGACCIVKQFNTYDDASIKDEQLQSLNVQYCCFSGCYPQTDNESLYGLALFCASKETVVYFSSTIDCPPTDHDISSGGAQIDIQSDYVKSKNVNITGGRAKYCGGIEYRYATKGHFKFQTISNIKECMFATSFTSISINDLEISFSNYDRNRLVNNAVDKDKNLKPGLIHIREKDIVISNFCFTKLIDDTNAGAMIISRGTYYTNEEGKEINHLQKIRITLNNCYRDSSISRSNVAIEYIDGEKMLFGSVDEDKNLQTNKIDQLLLGNCEGNIPPGEDVVIEDVNEATQVFSKSDDFTHSNAFTKTGEFTKTNGFSETGQFSHSSDFTQSQSFIPTLDLNHTHSFTPSKKFTPSKHFSESNDFSNSEEFSKTDGFSNSEEFSKTSPFTNSIVFSVSQKFTGSIQFTQSNSLMVNRDIIINDQSNKDKLPTGAKIGIGVGAAAAAAIIIAAVVIFFVKKRKSLNIAEDVDVRDETNSSTVTSNPLASIMENDDPFKEEFQ